MTTLAASLADRNRRVGLYALGLALAMIGLGFASVPLYRLFCQVTGFGGTTQRVSEAEASRINVTGSTISVRFDANVERSMPWQFRPEQVTQEVSLGDRRFTAYVAKNLTDKPVTGTATFNVEPAQAGKYFSKVQCFCFTEQTLQPFQEVRMPVVFYVDPRIKDDPDARDIEQITLSYTFHPVQKSASAALDQARAGG